MSESLPDTQVAELNKRLDALASAVEELRKAQTPAEKREAKEDVESAESALERYAKAHGITLEEAEDAMATVKRKSQVSLVKQALKEFSDDDWDEIFPKKEEGEGEGEKGEKPESKKPAAKKEEKQEKQKEDSAPGGEHWTDRKLFA